MALSILLVCFSESTLNTILLLFFYGKRYVNGDNGYIIKINNNSLNKYKNFQNSIMYAWVMVHCNIRKNLEPRKTIDLRGKSDHS